MSFLTLMHRAVRMPSDNAVICRLSVPCRRRRRAVAFPKEHDRVASEAS
jgi:hypothetical protein